MGLGLGLENWGTFRWIKIKGIRRIKNQRNYLCIKNENNKKKELIALPNIFKIKQSKKEKNKSECKYAFYGIYNKANT